MPEIDDLFISIEASTQNADKAIDGLIDKLGRLSGSLRGINTESLKNFSDSIFLIGKGMKSLEGIKLPDYTRLFKGIQKFQELDGAKLSSVSAGLLPISDAVRTFSNLNFDNKNLTSFINSLTKLAGADLSGLANANFKNVSDNILGLVNALSGADKVSAQTASLVNGISRLAQAGNDANIAAAALPSLRNELVRLVDEMGKTASASQETASLSMAIAQLANAGQKAGETAGSLGVLAEELKKLFSVLSTAPNVHQSIIDMTNALANLASQGTKVGSTSRSLVCGMSNTSNAMKSAHKSAASLAAAFGKIYASWFLVIRGAKQFVNAIKDTSDYIEAFNYYTVALGKIGTDWGKDYAKYGYANAEAYTKSFTERLDAGLGKLSGLKVNVEADGTGLISESGIKNLGLNIQEITQYASQLASVTNSVGQTGEVSLAAASAFTKLAGDISSLFNVDYSSAAHDIQSGLIGQSRAMYKYGIDITNATLQTYAYQLGLEKSVSAMTQAEKMQLRMISILEQSKVSWGDLANTINSPSNMLRQFTTNVKEAGMVLGQLFIPVLQKVMPVINGVVIAIKRLLVSVAQILGVKLDFSQFSQGYSDVSDGLDGIAESFDGVAASAKKAKAGLRAFDELDVINLPDAGGGAGGVGGGAIDLTEEILKSTSEYESIWAEAYERMTSKAQEFADKISKFLEPIKKIFQDFAIGDFFQAGKDVSRLVSGIFNFFADAIDRVPWYGIGQKIGDFLAGIDWTDILKSVGRLIWQALKASLELFAGMFDAAPIETGIISAVAVLKWTGLGKIIARAIARAIASKLGLEIAKNTGIKSAIKTGFSKLFAGMTFADILGIGTAITVVLDTEIRLRNKEDADRFYESMAKLNRLDFKNLDQIDKLNFFEEFFLSTFGLSASHRAKQTQIESSISEIPLKSNYGSDEEYSKAFEQYKEKYKNFNPYRIPGVEYDENGWNKSLVNLKNKLESWWNDDVLTWWNGSVVTWWNDDVSPWFTKEKWDTLASNIRTEVSKNWTELTNWWENTGIPNWWNNVSPWFTKEKWKTLASTMKSGISEKWTEFTNWWKDTGIPNWWNTNVSPWFTKEKWTFDGIRDGLKAGFNAAIEAAKGVWNAFASWINEALKFDFEGWDWSTTILGKKIEIEIPEFSFQFGKLPTFQNGGYVEDGLFMANHNELIGQFANGRTAVANNDMITAGIEEAAYKGFKRAMSESKGMPTNVTFKVEGDRNRIFKIVREEAHEYFTRSQKPAFDF